MNKLGVIVLFGTIFLSSNAYSKCALIEYAIYGTVSEGKFIAKNYFDSFEKTSLFKGDICSKKPSRIEIIVLKEGFNAKRIQFSISDLKTTEETDSHKIYLPDILIYEPVPSK